MSVIDFVFCLWEKNVGEPKQARGLKEDSALLMRGFDSIAHTLSQLSNTLDNALQVNFSIKCVSDLNWEDFKLRNLNFGKVKIRGGSLICLICL